jgi:hypothetical protein
VGWVGLGWVCNGKNPHGLGLGEKPNPTHGCPTLLITDKLFGIFEFIDL